MKLVLGHKNYDFDCLGSAVALKYIYKDTAVYDITLKEASVEKFLAFYKGKINFLNHRNINIQKIDTLILVDNHNLELPQELKSAARNKKFKYIIYDHHTIPEKLIKKNIKIFHKKAGANVSFITLMIKRKKIKIDPFDATVMMLGIYEETGNLSFSTVTGEDYEAAKYLLECGADLDLVKNFTNVALTDEQKRLLMELIKNSSEWIINHIPVTICIAQENRFIGDVALLAHKIKEIQNLDIIFLIVKMDNRIHIVGRNRIEHINIGKILSDLGGGGHAQAGSATIKGIALDDFLDGFKQILKDNIKPDILAEDFCSSSVYAISEDTKIFKAKKILLRLDYSALPVINKKKKLVGIIALSDIEKAYNHKLEHAPVKGFMITNPITIDLKTPLRKIQLLMAQNRVGRLPIVDKNNILAGIITRQDLIKVISPHFDKSEIDEKNKKQKLINIALFLKTRIKEKKYNLLKSIGKLADELNYKAYLVGGCVRDILLERKDIDIDIVVEGDGCIFAEKFVEKYKGEYKEHKKFKTAKIFYKNMIIDIATARIEYYSFPAALPDVETSTLIQDLYRRDFTINAMAIALNDENFGILIDMYDGYNDLQKGKIRILYNSSFIDDPTRILRAVRFKAKLNFEIEKNTFNQMKNCLDLNLLNNVSKERIREELDRILDLKNNIECLTLLGEFHIFKYLVKDLKVNQLLKNLMAKLNSKKEALAYEKYILYCYFAMAISCNKNLNHFFKYIHFSKNFQTKIIKSRELYRKKIKIWQIKNKVKKYNYLKKYNDEDIFNFFSLIEPKYKNNFSLLKKIIKLSKLKITNKDIKKFKIRNNKKLGKIIEKLKQQKIAGKIKTKKQEIEYLLKNAGKR